MEAPYPLQWPAGKSRRQPELRRAGGFKSKREGRGLQALTVAIAIERLDRELNKIGARYAVVSTNLETKLNGLPRSGQAEPRDPGVAVYFELAGKPHCLPCDTYMRVADNIAAVAAHIEATRAIERHGVATVAEMFAGFMALPSPEMRRPWREVFGLHREPRVTAAMVEDRYRELARERHPDLGGSDAMMAELNAAREAAKREIAA